MRVLVADDDAIWRSIICERLKRRGYDVSIASDGTEAMRLLESPDAPSLAILDWVMPGLDGIEICRKMRAQTNRPYVYVLLITSLSQKSDVIAGFEAGADDYLIKPFDFAELQMRLQVGKRILEAEQQLRHAQRIEALGLLTGGIAHDFNNIAMTISSHCEIALGKTQDPKLRNNIEQIQKAGKRAASLTQQLLAFSRKQVLSPSVLNVNDLISEIEPMIRRVIPEDVTLELMLAPDIWHVKVDAGQVERVLLNLTANARDAMPRGGKLAIKTENLKYDSSLPMLNGLGSGEYLVLSVSDNGEGMTREVQSRIFDPFFATKTKGKGTGLGLASVYGIVKQSGGYITVDSELEKGTTFAVYLKRCSEVENTAAAPSVKEVEPRTGIVLVVEDEESTRNAICDYLDSAGYKVCSAKDAAEALRVYRESSIYPDIVLSDVLMPGSSGPELAEEMRKINPAAKFIFMSGYADDFLTDRLQLTPGFRFLQKPFALSDLLTTINQTRFAEVH